MDENSITGFNPQLVELEIEKLYRIGACEVISGLYDDVDTFFRELSIHWYSPNALEFSNTYRQYTLDLLNGAAQKIIDLCQNATNAYNVNATVHGLGSISFDMAKMVFYSLDELHEISPDGKVGIDVYRTKKAIEQFRQEAYIKLNNLQSLPTSISLYDPQSEQRKQFLIALTTMKSEIEDDVSEMIKKVESALETEENTVFRAVQQSTESLSMNL